jgi:uncharacterized protein YndB with AHSA1/START domain
MKPLFLILIAVVSLLVLLLVVGLFIKKDYFVEREVIINRPNQMVFEYIKLLKNQNKYSVWATMDPAMKTEFRGTDGMPGFVSAWDSENKNVGKGEQEILKIENGNKVDYEIRFIKPFESTSSASMSALGMDDSRTKVTWSFTGRMNYPMNLMLVFMNMEKMIGNDLDKGLHNLKVILEN